MSWQDWKLITIKQNGIGRTSSWSALDVSAEIIVYGNPSLDEISQFVVGGESFKSVTNHQVLFNEIHVAESKILKGDAGKVAGVVQWTGTGMIGAVSAGVSRKSIGRNFETSMTGVYDRNYSEDNAHFNFNDLKVRTQIFCLLKQAFQELKP